MTQQNQTSGNIKTVCVYCGSSAGNDPDFARHARALGKLLCDNSIDLVYGGASIGIMGEIADAVSDGGGHVTGVIPHGLFQREVAHDGIQKLLVVDSMHERKALMARLSDAFITLPGGFGTLEELFEMITWTQLGIHHKPIILLNTNGFYNQLHQTIESISKAGFIRNGDRTFYHLADSPEEVISLLLKFQTRETAGQSVLKP